MLPFEKERTTFVEFNNRNDGRKEQFVVRTPRNIAPIRLVGFAKLFFKKNTPYLGSIKLFESFEFIDYG